MPMLIIVGLFKLHFIISLSTKMATILWIMPTISGNMKNIPICFETDWYISKSVVPSFLSIPYLPLSSKDSLNVLK